MADRFGSSCGRSALLLIVLCDFLRIRPSIFVAEQPEIDSIRATRRNFARFFQLTLEHF